ncbi:MAG TPA: nuclear transport factor 2 family protein [Parafilimonas sp.]|nr:nuclear transport factor 2 family protein [Parafilimonas sp.]
MTPTFSIRDEIVEVINKLFVYTDGQVWNKLIDEVFAGEVSFDMSSVGGEKMETTPENICAIWKKGFEGIDAVNHLAGNYLIHINNNTASAFAYATATHYKASAIKGNTREFVGTYNIGLIKNETGWRINQFKYNLKYITGNTDLA